jgi:hypothetical protein
MASPPVSIIINNHNYARFLPEAIQSALRQSYSPLEVIVVDDGSTDVSRRVIQDFGRQITAIYKENGGQASALNAGFARCRGEIVIFLDADDILFPEAAAQAVQPFQSDPQTVKVMYRMEVIDRLGQRTGIIKPHNHLAVYSGDIRRYELAFPFDLAWMPTSGNCFSAWFLREVSPIPEQEYGQAGADWYLAHVAPLFGTVHFLPQVLAGYRVHGANAYELSSQRLDLEHIRQSIEYARQTRIQIQKFADLLRLEGRPACPEDLLSISDLSNRMISLKLEPERHPVKQDSLWSLLRLSQTAARRRTDIHWPVKTLFVAWFGWMALAPRRLARWLAEVFTFPEKRRPLNTLLAGMKKNA